MNLTSTVATTEISIAAPALTPGLRMAILVYLAVWKLLPPLISHILHDEPRDYFLHYWLWLLVTYGVLSLPLAFTRFGGIAVSAAHPLVLLLALRLVWELFQDPASLAYPLTVWIWAVPAPTDNPILDGWPPEVVGRWLAFGQSLNALAATFVLVGFALSRAPFTVELRPTRVGRGVLWLLVATGIGTAIILIELRGGIVQHIASLSFGRFRALAGLGPVLALSKISVIAMLVLFVFALFKRVPVTYYAPIVIVCALPFVVSGSRGNIFLFLMMFLFAYVLVRRTIPWSAMAAIALVGVLSLGLLGEIRNIGLSIPQGTDSASTFDRDITSLLEKSIDETRARLAIDSFLPTIAMGPDKFGYLNGRTYLNSLGWFIPRAIWPEKPRGVGSHVTALIYGRGDGDGSGEYDGGGVPPGGVAEAYWNGGVLAVASVYFLYGLLIGFIAKVYFGSPLGVAFMLPLYIVSLVSFRDPTTNVITPFIQMFLTTLIVLYAAKLRPSFRMIH